MKSTIITLSVNIQQKISQLITIVLFAMEAGLASAAGPSTWLPS
jgi:hypothetical protein